MTAVAPHADPGTARPGPVAGPTAATAERAALAGDLGTALRTADAALREHPDPREQARAALVLAAVLPHRGLLARGADLHRWVVRRHPGVAGPAAVVALLGTGALDEARAAAQSDDGAAPGLDDAADTLTARGLLASVGDERGEHTALSLLARAATALEACDRAGLRGDTPAALGALVALHRGEPELAMPLLDRALEVDLGGPASRARHLLLRSWAAMVRGDEDAARADLAVAAQQPSEPRDELFAAALEVGLARRGGDVRRLLDLWARARQALVRHPVDLFALLPVGELSLAAARLGERGWVAPHVEEATALLDALGRPPLWSTPWHWYGLQEAITAEEPPRAAEHAAALAEAARTSHPAVAPARGARVWLRVLAGEVDADEVVAAATGLRAAGLGWDGARLAGEAAIRTTDRRAISVLLATARSLTPGSAGPAAPTAPGLTPGGVATPKPTAPEPATPPDAASAAPATSAAVATSGAATPGPATRTGVPRPELSDREREVAALVVEGLTYREIGARLFLSAKTVEHHVARMRQRLGSNGRGELFADLRTALGG